MIGVTQASVRYFTVTFNTHDVTFFTDSSLTEGDAGPCIWVGSYANEKFPDVPEDARFKMTAPDLYPRKREPPATSRRWRAG